MTHESQRTDFVARESAILATIPAGIARLRTLSLKGFKDN
jgi:hypothetical protein